MIISEILREHALYGTNVYDVDTYAFSAALFFSNPGDGMFSDWEDVVWRTFFLLVAEALEQS